MQNFLVLVERSRVGCGAADDRLFFAHEFDLLWQPITSVSFFVLFDELLEIFVKMLNFDAGFFRFLE